VLLALGRVRALVLRGSLRGVWHEESFLVSKGRGVHAPPAPPVRVGHSMLTCLLSSGPEPEEPARVDRL